MKTLFNTAIAATFLAAALPAAQANAATLVVDVTGAQSFFEFGDASNTIATFNIGANSRITAVAYNVTIEAFAPSYLSEAVVAFTGSDAFGDGVFLTPGFEDAAPGVGTYADSANLVDLGLDFTVGDDGILRLEYFEDFDDGSVSPDAIWRSGTLTFTYEPTGAVVPEPATWAMMIGGFGLAGAAVRRSKRTTRVAYSA